MFLLLQVNQSAAGLETEPIAYLNDASVDLNRNDKLLKITKDQQNQEKRFSSVGEIVLQADETIPPAVIEVEVEVSIQKKSSITESSCITDSPEGHNKDSKDKPVSPKNIQEQFSHPASNCISKGRHLKSVLTSRPSENSIISAAGLEELSDLRSYYNHQLRRINYISHEQLQDSSHSSGMLTCITEPLRSLRLPSSTAVAQSARNLWIRVSMKRKQR